MGTFKRNLIGMAVAEIVSKFRPVQSGPGILDKDLYFNFTIPAAAGTAKINLFNASAGDLSVTNIEEAGKMPVNRHQLVEAFDLTLVGAAAVEANRLADVNIAANEGNLVIMVGDKTVFRGGPLRKFIGQTALTNIDTTSGDQGRQPYVLANPILLEAGKTFQAFIEYPSGSAVKSAAVAGHIEFQGQEIAV